MTTIKTVADLVAWLEKWESDRAGGLVPVNEEAHRKLVIDLLKPFAAGERAALLGSDAAERIALAATLAERERGARIAGAAKLRADAALLSSSTPPRADVLAAEIVVAIRSGEG